MDSVIWVIASVILIRAVYTDIRRGKIENRLMVSGLAVGLLLAGLRGGPAGLWYSVKMAGIILLALFFVFFLKGLGAGDIKLLCVMAVLFPEHIFAITAAAFLIGAIWALGRMIIRRIRKEAFYIRRETINFSIPVALSVLMVAGRGW